MIEKPKLKSYLTVFPLAEGTWGLRGGSEELWRIRLSDERAIEALGALLPHLDGRLERGEILARLSGRGIDTEVAEKLLDQLAAASFLEEGGDQGLDSADAERFAEQVTFFSRFSQTGGARMQARLRDSRVAVAGDGALAASVVRHLVRSGVGEVVVLGDGAEAVAGDEAGRGTGRVHGARLDRATVWPVERSDDLPDLLILPLEAHDPQLLMAMDELSRSRKLPWMLVRSVDPQLGWVGPLFVPGDTASYLSLEARLRGNMPFYEEQAAFDGYLLGEGRPAASGGGLAPFFDLLSGIAVTEVIKHLTRFAVPQLAGRFLTVSPFTWETELHEVLRVPHLEALSDPRPALYSWKELPYGETKTRRA